MTDKELQDEILNFVKTREGVTKIKLNDFIKSAYGVPEKNMPPVFLLLDESKRIKRVLTNMQEEKQFSIIGNTHLLLGKIYYEGVQQNTRHYNLTQIEIFAEK